MKRKILAAVLIIGAIVGAFVLFVPVTDVGGTPLVLCWDGTLVDDETECPPLPPDDDDPDTPPPKNLLVGTFNVAIFVYFTDGTSKLLTRSTPLDSLAVFYEGKEVDHFRFDSSISTADMGVKISARPEGIIALRTGSILHSESGQTASATVLKQTASSLFGMNIGSKFFLNLAAGEVYTLSFVSHIQMDLDLDNDGTYTSHKEARVVYTIAIELTGGGGGGGGGDCYLPSCDPLPLGMLGAS